MGTIHYFLASHEARWNSSWETGKGPGGGGPEIKGRCRAQTGGDIVVSQKLMDKTRNRSPTPMLQILSILTQVTGSSVMEPDPGAGRRTHSDTDISHCFFLRPTTHHSKAKPWSSVYSKNDLYAHTSETRLMIQK